MIGHDGRLGYLHTHFSSFIEVIIVNSSKLCKALVDDLHNRCLPLVQSSLTKNNDID